jgi:TRAP-type C4-dicarboxylate transport system substrate-binding protein
MKKLNSSLIALAAAMAMSAQATEFRSADIHNADDYPTVVAVKHMSTVLEKLSGGKHKIKVFNKGALGSEKETIDQVKIGALDLVRVNVAPMNGVCPMTMVPTMPFLFSSVDHMRKSLDGPIGAEILKSCESVGYVGLAFYDSGARSIYAKKAIKIYPARDERGDGSFERCTPDASARFPTHNIAFRRSLCLWQREKWSLSHPGPNRPRGHVGDGLGIVLHPPASQSTVRR